MSPRAVATRPTEAELAILNYLWAHGEVTVRDVHQALYGDEGGYTTALKMLQVMHGKGLVERNDSQRAHVYRAAITKDSTQRRLLTDMVQRLFDGRPGELVLRALGSEQPPSDEEMNQIRALLDRLERDRHG